MRRIATWALRLSVVVLAGVVWELVARTFHSFFFPPISAVLARAYQIWVSGAVSGGLAQSAVYQQLVPSLQRALAGWGLAILIGVLVGSLIGLSRHAAALFEPVIHYLRGMPAVATISIFVIVLGISDEMRVAVIAFGCTWPILLNTVHGVNAVDPVQLETARVFGIRRLDRIRSVVLPAAAPSIFAGLRISLPVALILMIVSEMVVGGTGGLGNAIEVAQRNFSVIEMWTGIVVIGLLGFVLNQLLELLERRALRWHRQSLGGVAQ